ncbi:MAG: hypothetical protein OXI76_03335, partial [Gemmatimonadota bacterium]|nr:hypothetical protein [Gemmatimonadota bacterium]
MTSATGGGAVGAAGPEDVGQLPTQVQGGGTSVGWVGDGVVVVGWGPGGVGWCGVREWWPGSEWWPPP